MSQSATEWRPAYVGIGSNLHGPARQVELAIAVLDEIRDTHVTARSHLYRSSPLGGIEQPDFVNAVVSLLTLLEPMDLLEEMQTIESARGRERTDQRWGPRVIDLDLLVFADLVIEEPNLQLPHPGIGERNFVLLPLRELAPDLVIPGLGCVSAIPVNEQEPRITRIA